MKIEFNYQNQVLTLPGAAILKVQTATETDLKLLLLLASDQTLLEGFDAARAAELLGVGQKEVELSLSFWRGAGIVKCHREPKGIKRADEGKNAPQKSNAPQENAPEKGGEDPFAELSEEQRSEVKRAERMLPFAVKSADLPVYTGAEVEELVESKPGLDRLLHECQLLLEKVFNVSESKKIIALSDTLRLSDSYILLLCSYCVSLGKGTVPYVATTACELYNADIKTEEALEEYIAKREKDHDFESRIRHLLGLGGRKLTQKEKKFFENWQQMDFPFEVISFAYELSVNAKGVVALPHINAILEGFKKAEVTTLQEAQIAAAAKSEEMKRKFAEENARTGKGQSGEKKSDFVSFDSEDFFKAAKNKGLSKLKKEG
ncbi:MAG: DnaD domain protein [Clostridia bacterium]|nr:DnaD domain protein [Clostridia bacterium]